MILFHLLLFVSTLFSSAIFENTQTKPYRILFHIKSERYLYADGQAHVVVYDNNALFMFEELSPAKTIFYTYPWNITNNRFALDIIGGCSLGASVKKYKLNKSTNQIWKIEDGIIYSACNPKWIMHVDNHGVQTVKNIDEVPEDDRKFNITQSDGVDAFLVG